MTDTSNEKIKSQVDEIIQKATADGVQEHFAEIARSVIQDLGLNVSTICSLYLPVLVNESVKSGTTTQEAVMHSMRLISAALGGGLAALYSQCLDKAVPELVVRDSISLAIAERFEQSFRINLLKHTSRPDLDHENEDLLPLRQWFDAHKSKRDS